MPQCYRQHCAFACLPDVTLNVHSSWELAESVSIFKALLGTLHDGCHSSQEVLGEENADQVAINFFGDGTCNVGESVYTEPIMDILDKKPQPD